MSIGANVGASLCGRGERALAHIKPAWGVMARRVPLCPLLGKLMD